MTPQAVKERSEAIILGSGGRICDGLPVLSRRNLRPVQEIGRRLSILHGLAQIPLGTPPAVVWVWLEDNALSSFVSTKERSWLLDPEPAEASLIEMSWYPEAAAALAWILELLDELPFDRFLHEEVAAMLPDLEAGEPAASYLRHRSSEQVFAMLDLYFRWHWYARDGWLRRQPTPPVELSVILERRKALEWALDPECDWDRVPDGT